MIAYRQCRERRSRPKKKPAGVRSRGQGSLFRPRSDQALEQILQLPHLGLHGVRRLRHVVQGDRQQAVVVEALELRDNAAVLDLALADADLELARAAAGV